MTKEKYYDYPSEVINDVRDWFEENQGVWKMDYEICSLPRELVLELYLEWNGIIGYNHSIIKIFTCKEEE